MGLIVSFGDYGVGDIVEKAEDLYQLLLDLCEDKLHWDNILEKPELYEKSEVYNKEEIIQMLEDFEPIALPINISDVTDLQDELDDRYTKEEVDESLEGKSDIGHTHPVSEIDGLEEAIQALGVQIVDALPFPIENGKVYILHAPGQTRFLAYISAGGAYIPLNAVTYEALATALAAKQNKLTGTANQLVLGDGTYIDRNKSAVGLGNVDNTSDANKPISNAQAAVNAQKANDADVLHKNGNETIASGVKTFLVSPEVPAAAGSNDAVNLGQVQGLISDLAAEVSHPEEVKFESPSEQWIWPHGKNLKPVFDIIVGGQKVHAKEEYPDNDTVIISFTNPQAGVLIAR